MNGIRILIALAAVALAAVVAAAPASPQSLGVGSPLLGDQDLGVNLPNLGGGSSGGSAGSGGGGGGGGGNAATGNVTSGDTSADANVACIDANVLDITAKIGSCKGAGGGGGGEAGDGAGGGGERGAADAEAGSGELGANAGVGCVDIGLGDLGNGLQIGSCEAIMPPSTEDPGDDGSGELPTETGDGVAGADAGADGSAGDQADCIAYDELSNSGLPYGIPPWLAGILGVVVGAFIARRRRPQAEDVAV